VLQTIFLEPQLEFLAPPHELWPEFCEIPPKSSGHLPETSTFLAS